jgi:hypothetical protein
MKYLICLLMGLTIAFQCQGHDPESENRQLESIPYDSIKAKIDLGKGLVRIIDLISPTYEAERTRLQDIIEPEQLREVEKNMGFVFVDIYIDSIAPKYLTQREEEYNASVYEYLSARHGRPAKSLIKNTILDIYRAKRAE